MCMLSSVTHFSTTLPVCCRSSSCWKVLCWVFLQTAWCSPPEYSSSPLFMIPFALTWLPGPSAERRTHCFPFSPWCLTVGIVFSWLYASHFLLSNKSCPYFHTAPFSLSSELRIDEFLICPGELLQRLGMSWRSGVLLRQFPWRPVLCCVDWRVCLEMLTPELL